MVGSISDVLPLDYTLEIFGLAEGYYVKKAQIGTEEVIGRRIDLTHSSGPLDVVISSSGGIISGSVLDHEEQPAAGIDIALVPNPPRPDIPDLYKLVHSDQSGQYSIAGIAPGKYQLFAIEGVDSEAYLNADFIQSIGNYGETVDIMENSRVTLTLRSR